LKGVSLSEKALQYMQQFHNRESNYFQNKLNQREARQGFIDLYNLEQKKGEDIWNHTFPKFLRKNRLKKEDFLKTRFRKSKVSDINATIKPEPQNFTLEKNSVEIVNEEIQQDFQTVQTDIQIKNQYLEPEVIESVFEGIWTLLQLWLPVESLTKEEKESLGMMWLPAFRLHLTENWAYVGLPLLFTIGLFGKRVIDARRIRKEDNLQIVEEEKEVSE
jgi:hypothetical protein